MLINVKLDHSLSDRMLQHLSALLPGPRSAYPGLKMGTLNALERRGMVKAKRGLGSIAMPHTSIKWSLTAKGRAQVDIGGVKLPAAAQLAALRILAKMPNDEDEDEHGT